MEIINWVLDAILFAKSGVADVIDVSWFICDGPQLSMKPLAERDCPSGREANGMNTEQGTGDRASLPDPNAVLEAQSLLACTVRFIFASLSLASASLLHHSLAPPF